MRKTYRLLAVVAVAAVVLGAGAVAAYASLATDTTPPTTTSDVAATTYWNTVAINLSATDNEGVAYIYHELDNGIVRLYTVTGGVAQVAAPRDSGGDPYTPSPGVHTLAFWSQDVNGNVEARHSVEFTFGVDTDAPTTAATGATDGVWRNTAADVNLAATDNAAGSGVESITSTLDGGTPVVATTATTDVAIATDGTHTLTYQAEDVAGNVESLKTLTVKVDTVAPAPKGTAIASARRGRTATLKYRVDDALPNGGTANVVIKVKNSAGKVVKTFTIAGVAVNTALTRSFKVPSTWRIGTYKYYVSATDTAGNAQVKAGVNKLIVK